jgi:DNA-binding transcriptional regulator YiaG
MTRRKPSIKYLLSISNMTYAPTTVIVVGETKLTEVTMANRLNRIREEQDLSQAELSRRSGVSQQYISVLEA